ncbi:unnamed protein product [Clonostachys solani]|uniref:Uncharacterized protein n=1 Tax=Clonostachys solani TaxID=160281 RepID=A0A9P0EM18_9HYPO|nr:unnamed protein product [Clonostachys solani]
MSEHEKERDRMREKVNAWVFDPSISSKFLSAPTFAESAASAEEVTARVLCSYQSLQAIVMLHEAKIQNRWTKKTKEDRRKLLLQAWPQMNKQRPGCLRVEKQIISKLMAARRTAGKPLTYEDFSSAMADEIWSSMWAPGVNQEDLCRPRNLLLLIKSRARNHPYIFAAQDGFKMLNAQFRKQKEAIRTETVVFLNSEKDYGKVMLRDDVPPPYDGLFPGILFQIPEGIGILRCQKRLLEFLLRSCMLILHDIPDDEIISDKYPVQPEPQVKKIQADKNRYVSLSTMVEEAAYLPPPHGLDIHRIESLLSARLAAAEDHMLALREDPSYFEAQWREELDHNPGLVKDSQGRQGYVLNAKSGKVLRPGPALMWAHSLARMRQKAYEQLQMFDMLRYQVTVIKEHYLIHRPTITPQKNLPGPLLYFLVWFRNTLHKALKVILLAIDEELASSPRLRRCFIRPDGNHQDAQIRSSVQESTVDFQCIKQVQSLLRGREVVELDNMSAYLDSLSRFMKDKPDSHELLSGALAGHIGDLSIITQCTNQLQTFYPWSRIFDEAMESTDEQTSYAWTVYFNPIAEATSSLVKSLLRDIPLLCDPTDQKYDHPSTKRKTKLNTDKMRQAESNLDILWDFMDQQAILDQNLPPDSRMKCFHQAHHPKERTPEWIEPSPQPIKHAPSSPRTGDEVPFSMLERLRIASEQSPVAEEPRKPKTKTRGKPSAKAPSLPAPPNAEEEEPIEEQIKVNARAFRAFQKLFFDPDAHSEGKDLPWKDFLYAMTYKGLFSAESLNGSLWVFRNQATGNSLNFHEPHHPNPKISAYYARRIGTRMKRRLGWHAKTFVMV